jgi:hypothetical protein
MGRAVRRGRGPEAAGSHGEGACGFFPERADGDEPPAPKGTPDRRGHWLERLGWEFAGIAGFADASLRQLVWAAREKRRLAGELAAWHLTEIAARIPFTGGKRIDPAAINPYRTVTATNPENSQRRVELETWQAEARVRLAAGLPVIPLERRDARAVQGPSET